MAFTNVWDVTFPPDTQLANLLGSDLRVFRVDTQQRMAAISGLDASKPTFGSDAQPANWNGVLFFATDTGKVYQWTNPSWIDVSTQLLSRRLAATGGSTNANGQILLTVTIPSGTLSATLKSFVRVVVAFTVASGSPVGQLIIGGNGIANSTGYLEAYFMMLTNTSLTVTGTTNNSGVLSAFVANGITVSDVTANSLTISIIQSGPAGTLTGYFMSGQL